MGNGSSNGNNTQTYFIWAAGVDIISTWCITTDLKNFGSTISLTRHKTFSACFPPIPRLILLYREKKVLHSVWDQLRLNRQSPPWTFSFFEKFGMLCFLETPILWFALLLYYRRNQFPLCLWWINPIPKCWIVSFISVIMVPTDFCKKILSLSKL